MPLPTLEEFIERSHESNSCISHSRAFVRHPKFRSLYVRFGPRFLGGVKHPRVLDIASIEARVYGRGAFTKLLETLKGRGFQIYVESVLNERFKFKLLRLGFTEVGESYYLLCAEKKDDARRSEDQPSRD